MVSLCYYLKLGEYTVEWLMTILGWSVLVFVMVANWEQDGMDNCILSQIGDRMENEYTEMKLLYSKEENDT